MKRLLCFFDGTWNRPDAKDELTNVVKLFRAVPETAPDGTRQHAHYEIGIATEETYKRWRFAVGTVGVGIGDRIQSGYRFLIGSYEPGDEIYLFGFSRGAFQARSLGGLLALVGILKTAEAGRAGEAWQYYHDHKDAPDAARLASLRAAAHFPVRIRCIGVWDTVGDLGIPFAPTSKLSQALAFHETGLTPIVDVGLHALAIDEPRGPFRPTLWTRKRGAAGPPGQIVEQVWFPGCHANVGGGYKDCALSDISLLWMAERAMAATGVVFDLERLRSEARPDPLGEAVSPTATGLFRLSRLLPFVRLIHQNPKGIPPWRRTIIGSWRSSRLPAGDETVGEQIHDSAIVRYGNRVRLRRGDKVSQGRYRPRTLKMALRRPRRRWR